MKRVSKTRKSDLARTQDPTFRSAAVARMVAMPVATLRIWEQRYQAVKPTAAPSGHRLYSPADVERVTLLRQLTEQGHAIGSIASLDSSQLQHIARTSVQTDQGEPRATTERERALRIAIVGPALALRVQRPSVVQQLLRKVRVVAVYESLEEASTSSNAKADILLWFASELPSHTLSALEAAQLASGASRLAVMYRFANTTAIEALSNMGAVVAREPSGDEAFSTWLNSLNSTASLSATDGASKTHSSSDLATRLPATSSRRYDDATLTTIAGLEPKMACECPGHIAELLMQLSSFENYSASCVNESPADAQLHAYLRQVASASRVLFEAALERVAKHEGLSLR